jgi:hypothetical protein
MSNVKTLHRQWCGEDLSRVLRVAARDGALIGGFGFGACWNDLLAVLDRLGQTAVPSREWLVKLVAGDTRGQPIVVRGQQAITA